MSRALFPPAKETYPRIRSMQRASNSAMAFIIVSSIPWWIKLVSRAVEIHKGPPAPMIHRFDQSTSHIPVVVP